MAGVRSRLTFYDDYGVEYQFDIYDANFVGTRLDFDQGENLTIRYEAENNENQFSPFLFSKAELTLMIKDSAEQTELLYLINNQFEDFIVEIYKAGSIYWRGKLLTDQIQYDNISTPYRATLSAYDGLKGLEKVQQTTYNFDDTLAEGFVTLLSLTGVFANAGATDTVLKTANRWYENSMPATGTGVDPLIYIRFASTTYFDLLVDGSTTERINAFEILTEFLKRFKMRCLMVNGSYHLIQVDQYAEGVLYLHSYPKNYPTSSASVTSFDPDVVPTIQGGGNFSYTPEIGEAKAEQNIQEGGIVFNQIYRTDWDSAARTLATVTNFNVNSNINLEFVTGPTAWWEYTGTLSNIGLFALQAEFEIKVVLASTYYLTNKNGVLEWTTTSSDKVLVRVNNVNVLARSTTTITADASNQVNGANSSILTLPVLPAGGALTLEIDVRLIDPSGSGVTTGVTLSSVTAGVKGYYVDPTIVEGNILYKLTNSGSESSYVYNEGKVSISDTINANFPSALSVFNGSSYVYTSNWKRQAVGTAYPIVNLGLRQVLEWSDKPLEILNGSTIKSTLTALSRLELYSKKYIMNRASYDVKADRWTGSWIEFQSSNGGPTIGLEDPIDVRGGVSSSYKTSNRVNNRYFDLLENSVLKLASITAEASGTITSLTIPATGFDIDNLGSEIILVHPVTGESDTLELSGDWLQATTSLSVTSIALSRTYPVGSFIYMQIGQLLQKVFNLENP